MCSDDEVRPVPPFFLFDGDCGFCKKWARWLQHRLPAGVTFVPYQEVEDLDRFGLTEGDVATASYWIDEDAAPHGGARSFACALRQGGAVLRAVGTLLDAPLFGDVADRLYPFIARNRHRLPAPQSPDDD